MSRNKRYFFNIVIPDERGWVKIFNVIFMGNAHDISKVDRIFFDQQLFEAQLARNDINFRALEITENR